MNNIYEILEHNQNKLETLLKYGDNRKHGIISSLKYNSIKFICDNSTVDDSVVLFCIIRNEYHHIDLFINYYRQMGIKTFVFLDNNSDDGTKEFLMKQEGVILYSCEEQYNAIKEIGWMNYLLLLHGLDKYCLIADADEYMTYMGCEEHDIHDIVSVMEKNNIKRVGGFLVDMYPKGELFKTTATDFLSDYRYFDYTGYHMFYTRFFGTQVVGGPRRRCFKCKNFLGKTPFFYYSGDNDDILATKHYLLPVVPTDKQMFFGIRHYKFLDKIDFEKVKDAVEKQYHFSNSIDYKTYLKGINATMENDNKYPTFYDDRYSMEFQNSNSLRNIALLKDPFE